MVVLRSVIYSLRELWSVTLEWIEFGCVHKLYPLNRIVRTRPSISRSSTCNRHRFDNFATSVAVIADRTAFGIYWQFAIPKAVRSAITATDEFLVNFTRELLSALCKMLR